MIISNVIHWIKIKYARLDFFETRVQSLYKVLSLKHLVSTSASNGAFSLGRMANSLSTGFFPPKFCKIQVFIAREKFKFKNEVLGLGILWNLVTRKLCILSKTIKIYFLSVFILLIIIRWCVSNAAHLRLLCYL